MEQVTRLSRSSGPLHLRCLGVFQISWISINFLLPITTLNAQAFIDGIFARKKLLEQAIPDIHTILYDGDDFSINDGGADMYDTGNYISTDRQTAAISYQFDTMVRDAAFGENSQRKVFRNQEGVFILAAQDMDIATFKVSGNLGADGGGFSKSLTFTVDGYRAFAFGSYGTSDASVNHLILVEDNGTATQIPPSSLENYVHEISNLSGSTKLIYILFATKRIGTLTEKVPDEVFHNLAQRLVAGLMFSHRCVVKNQQAYCWGSNKYGELGRGGPGSVGTRPRELESLAPVNLGSEFRVKQVDTGNNFSCATSVEGAVKCWGANASGQLGLQDSFDRGMTPESLGENLQELDFSGANIVRTQLGRSHACALSEAGSVRCWGGNEKGQLGQGHTNSIGDDAGEAPSQVNLGSDFKAVDLSCGTAHCCATDSLGQLKCWGDNAKGQLGLGDIQARGTLPEQMGDALPFVNLGADFSVIQVSAGGEHTCVLSELGVVRCFGDGSEGKLGNASMESAGGSPESVGDNLVSVDFGRDQVPESISCSLSHCCAKFIQQTLKCWGSNSFGMLGYGDVRPRGDSPKTLGEQLQVVPLQVGDGVSEVSTKGPSTCARTQRGLICWGYEANGITGNGLVGLGSTGSTPKTIPARLSPLPF